MYGYPAEQSHSEERMPRGLFTLKQQLQGVEQSAWIAPFGNTYGAKFAGNGSGQYLLGPTTGALNFSTGNFTVEMWLYMNAYGGGGLTVVFSASNASADFQFGVGTSNNVYWHNSGVQITSASTAFALGRWAHIALVRSGSNCAIFANGVRVGTATNSSAVNLTNFNVGSYQASPAAYMLDGFVSNLRITNTAVYDPTATSYVLPTTSLTAISGTQLLTLQNATIIDNSTNALSITNNGSVATQIVNPFGLQRPTPAVDYLVVAGGGSGKSDGYGGGGAGGLLQGSVPVISGSSITVTVGAGGATGGGAGGNSVFRNISALGGAYAVQYGPLIGGSGAGPFNWTSTGSEQQSFSTYGQGNDGGQSLLTSPSGSGGGGAGTKGLTGTSAGGGNGGAGIASAISGTVTTYAGGGGGGAYGVTTNASGGVGGGGIGSSTGGSSGTSGQTNTGGGGGSGNNAGGSGIVILSYPDIYAGAASTTGSPTVSTSGSGSLLPGSTSSWIYYAAQSGFAFGTGDFTIEFWVNFYSTTSGASGTSYLFDFRGASNPSNSSLGIFQNSAGMQLFTPSGYNPNYGVPATNTWLNIAISRVSGTVYWFVNGNLVSSGADSTNCTVGSTGPSFMGSSFYNNYGLQGYMSNIRVIKGTGLYTSNYTVTTTPYTAVTNTQLLLNTVSGGYLADGSTNAYAASVAGTVAWNQASPFGTGLGYKNRVYTWTSSGSVTF
jgi:hypothetical protein